jgi:hypothetical protein
MHTNRTLRSFQGLHANRSGLSQLHIVTGWFPDIDSKRVEAEQRKFAQQQQEQKLKPWNLLQVFKYEWLLRRVLSDLAHTPDALWLLADTDTLFTCSAEELAERFRRFGSALVVSVEKQRRGVHKPLPSKDGEDTSVYWRADRLPAEPNSGRVASLKAARTRGHTSASDAAACRVRVAPQLIDGHDRGRSAASQRAVGAAQPRRRLPVLPTAAL